MQYTLANDLKRPHIITLLEYNLQKLEPKHLNNTTSLFHLKNSFPPFKVFDRESILKKYLCNIIRCRIKTDFPQKCSNYKTRAVDVKAAYDSITRGKLYTAMREFDTPTKLIRLTRLSLTNVRSQIKAAGSLSIPFNINKGVRQGDVPSCVRRCKCERHNPLQLHPTTGLRRRYRYYGTDNRDVWSNRRREILRCTLVKASTWWQRPRQRRNYELLVAFQRRILRTIFGPYMRTNDTVAEITTVMDKIRLKG